MTRWFGSGLAVIPNLFRDLDFRFRNLGFKAPPCERCSFLLMSESTELKSRFRALSLRVKRSNPAFFNEIATHLSGARNDRNGKEVHSLIRDLGLLFLLTNPLYLVIIRLF